MPDTIRSWFLTASMQQAQPLLAIELPPCP
jgi:hypothetical protein